MAETEEIYTTEVIVDAGSAGHEVVLADMHNDFVAEEVVVVDASGGQAINTGVCLDFISIETEQLIVTLFAYTLYMGVVSDGSMKPTDFWKA